MCKGTGDSVRIEPVPAAGFYARREEPYSFLRCLSALACPGGEVEACGRGYTGDVCALCASGYYSLHYSCLECAGGNRSVAAGAIAIVIIVMAVLHILANPNEKDERETALVTSSTSVAAEIGVVRAVRLAGPRRAPGRARARPRRARPTDPPQHSNITRAAGCVRLPLLRPSASIDPRARPATDRSSSSCRRSTSCSRSTSSGRRCSRRSWSTSRSSTSTCLSSPSSASTRWTRRPSGAWPRCSRSSSRRATRRSRCSSSGRTRCTARGPTRGTRSARRSSAPPASRSTRPCSPPRCSMSRPRGIRSRRSRARRSRTARSRCRATRRSTARRSGTTPRSTPRP